VRNFGFGLVLLTAVGVVACGRQVTPNPVGLGPGGAPEGFASVFFDVAQPFNFSSYQYWIIFDTTGDGQTPSTQPYNNNYAGYSDGIEVAGNGGSTFAQPIEFVKNSNPHIPPYFQVLPFTPQNFIYNANSNGTGTEFNVIFRRSIFLGIPRPSPSPLAHNWTYNAFTTQATTLGRLVFVDSMGAGGKLPPQYSSPTLPTWQCFDNPYTALSLGNQIDPPAQIMSVEIANNPSPTPSVKPSAVPCATATDDVDREFSGALYRVAVSDSPVR
jgi:hypothetical protein